MERAIIYYAKTGLEATDHFVPKLLEKYCQDNGANYAQTECQFRYCGTAIPFLTVRSTAR